MSYLNKLQKKWVQNFINNCSDKNIRLSFIVDGLDGDKSLTLSWIEYLPPLNILECVDMGRSSISHQLRVKLRKFGDLRYIISYETTIYYPSCQIDDEFMLLPVKAIGQVCLPLPQMIHCPKIQYPIKVKNRRPIIRKQSNTSVQLQIPATS
jgi:hypothetical protein